MNLLNLLNLLVATSVCLHLAGSVAGAQEVPATRVVMLGTGTPSDDPERSGPAVAVVLRDQVYLVDAGPGIVRRAAAAVAQGVFALRTENLGRVFITHLHSDHTLGLPDLMFSPWVLGRTSPLEVYGPPGIAQMVAHLQEAFAADVSLRLSVERLSEAGVKTVAREIKAGRIYDDGVVRVDAIPVAHLSWRHAFGYRFSTPDRTIVVSGDARPTAALAEACNRCDILVHEVYSKAFFAGHGPQSRRYHAAAHTSSVELADLATKAQPGLLVLYHQLFGGVTDRELEREIAAAGYRGRVVSARDLDIF